MNPEEGLQVGAIARTVADKLPPGAVALRFSPTPPLTTSSSPVNWVEYQYGQALLWQFDGGRLHAADAALLHGIQWAHLSTRGHFSDCARDDDRRQLVIGGQEGGDRQSPSPGLTTPMADRDALLADAETTAFEGWDFSRLGDRLVTEPPPWDFAAIVADEAARASTMLDMGTGGGEWLSSLRVRATFTVATESWPPNVPVACARLAAAGVPVVRTEGAPDNHRQEPTDPTGRLPFRTGAFDLVSNRHESFRAREVARVLRPGGVFLTQQAHSGSRQFHELLGTEPPGVDELELDLVAAQLRGAGLTIEEAEVGTATTVFADIGALAWYLRSVPWAVPGFSVRAYREALLRLPDGPIRVVFRSGSGFEPTARTATAPTRGRCPGPASGQLSAAGCILCQCPEGPSRRRCRRAVGVSPGGSRRRSAPASSSWPWPWPRPPVHRARPRPGEAFRRRSAHPSDSCTPPGARSIHPAHRSWPPERSIPRQRCRWSADNRWVRSNSRSAS